jgi:hypothetical protein
MFSFHRTERRLHRPEDERATNHDAVERLAEDSRAQL